MDDTLLSSHQDNRFRIILWAILIFYAVAGVGITLMKIPPKAAGNFTSLPPRIAKLIIPPKPKAPPEPEIKTTETTAEEEVVSEAVEPEPEAVEVSETPLKSPEEIAAQQRRRDREVAMKSGLLSLLTSTDMSSFSSVKAGKTFSGIKSVSRNVPTALSTGVDVAGGSGGIDDIINQLESSLQGFGVQEDESLSRSGGIGLAEATDIGGENLEDRKTTAVDNPFKIKGYADGDSPRTYESIAQVVEKFKGGVSIIYNRALRRDPTLRGTVTVEFTIAADGEVVDSKIATSTMDDPAFEEAVARRVLGWRFPPIAGAGDVTVVYPLVFYVTG